MECTTVCAGLTHAFCYDVVMKVSMTGFTHPIVHSQCNGGEGPTDTALPDTLPAVG